VDLGKALIVYRKELKDMLRDRRTLISAVVFPLVLFPLMSVGIGTLMEKSVKKVKEQASKVMLLGEANAPELAAVLREAEGLEIVPPSENYPQQISDRKVAAAVEFPTGFERAVRQGAAEPPALNIYYYTAQLRSEAAVRRIEEIVQRYREKVIAGRLEARGVSPSILKPVETKRENAAQPEKVGGAKLAGIIPYFIILLSLMGAVHPAIDLTAGEKERGTMETILASGLGRRELVAGKFLLVLTMALLTAALSIFSFVVTMYFSETYFQEMTRGYAFRISPQAIAWVFLMVLPLVIFFSATLLALALSAKNYKEAQSHISPLMIGAILPAVMAMVPGIELNTRLALVPVLNVSLLLRELLTGNFPVVPLLIVFGSTLVIAGIALAAAVWQFQREEVLLRE
jgi:sodium transport system permease protein